MFDWCSSVLRRTISIIGGGRKFSAVRRTYFFAKSVPCTPGPREQLEERQLRYE